MIIIPPCSNDVVRHAYLKLAAKFHPDKNPTGRERFEQVGKFLPTVPTFAVRETNVSQHNGGTAGAPLKPLRDDIALVTCCSALLIVI